MTRIMMLILGIAGLGLSACNTVEGFGQDVEAGGETITETADEVEDDI